LDARWRRQEAVVHAAGRRARDLGEAGIAHRQDEGAAREKKREERPHFHRWETRS
jgi:hypothetical protein